MTGVKSNVCVGAMSKLDVECYIGSEIAQMRSNGERPPRSAKLLARVDLGGGPGGGDYRAYFLSSDVERSGWTLWQSGADYDTGKPFYCRVAHGTPYRGVKANDAAEQLLTKAWEYERDLEGSEPQWVIIEEPGLLGLEDFLDQSGRPGSRASCC